MKGYVANIEEQTVGNSNFRQVLFTGVHAQLVVMSLKVGEEIGLETHDNVDQFFRIEGGKAKVVIDDEEAEVENAWAFIVPAGSKHNVINIGDSDLKLYTIYSPPNHPDGTIHATKEDAVKAEEAKIQE